MLPSWVAMLMVCECLHSFQAFYFSLELPSSSAPSFHFFLGCFLLLLQLFLRFFNNLREIIYDLWLNFHLSYALLVWPVFDANHLAFFLMSGPKLKLFFFSFDVEMDLLCSNINLCFYRAEEWSPKNER